METLEFEKTVAGLPRLLQQLEIPESAVGLIFEKRHVLAERGAPAPLAFSDSSVGNVTLSQSGGGVSVGAWPWWTWAAAALAVLAVTGLGGLVVFRLRSAAKDGPAR